MDNEELLNMRFKICDNLQYEVDEEGIVTILEKLIIFHKEDVPFHQT